MQACISLSDNTNKDAGWLSLGKQEGIPLPKTSSTLHTLPEALECFLFVWTICRLPFVNCWAPSHCVHCSLGSWQNSPPRDRAGTLSRWRSRPTAWQT